MKKEQPSQHSPGAQGHDATLRAQIDMLQRKHDEMMGNLADDTRPEDMTDDFSGNATEKLYLQQSPKDYQNKLANARARKRVANKYSGDREQTR